MSALPHSVQGTINCSNWCSANLTHQTVTIAPDNTLVSPGSKRVDKPFARTKKGTEAFLPERHSLYLNRSLRKVDKESGSIRT